MRVSKFVPTKGAPDPKTKVGVLFSFLSGHVEKTPQDYDLYFVGGSVYVVRDGHVAVFTDQGAVFIDGDDGRRLAADFAKKWPRPKDAPASSNT